jgi:anti-sigma factor RsiW
MAGRDDIELMQHVDGELPARRRASVEERLTRDPDARAKVEALDELHEIVRTRLELAADDVPDHRFELLWRKVAREIEHSPEASLGWWGRLTAWLDRYRGHVITGAVSAGAVAALALILRPGAPSDPGVRAFQGGAIDVRPAAMRTAPEIEALDTPGGEGTVINLVDEDGHTAVIWVTPDDTVEGI